MQENEWLKKEVARLTQEKEEVDKQCAAEKQKNAQQAKVADAYKAGMETAFNKSKYWKNEFDKAQQKHLNFKRTQAKLLDRTNT